MESPLLQLLSMASLAGTPQMIIEALVKDAKNYLEDPTEENLKNIEVTCTILLMRSMNEGKADKATEMMEKIDSAFKRHKNDNV